MSLPILLANGCGQCKSDVYIDSNGRDIVNAGILFVNTIRLDKKPTDKIMDLDRDMLNNIITDIKNLKVENSKLKDEVDILKNNPYDKISIFYPDIIYETRLDKNLVSIDINRYILEDQLYDSKRVPAIGECDDDKHICLPKVSMVTPIQPKSKYLKLCSKSIKINQGSSTAKSYFEYNTICFKRGYRYQLEARVDIKNETKNFPHGSKMNDFGYELYLKTNIDYDLYYTKTDKELLIHSMTRNNLDISDISNIHELNIDFTLREHTEEEKKKLLLDKYIDKYKVDNNKDPTQLIIDEFYSYIDNKLDDLYTSFELDYTDDIIVAIRSNSFMDKDSTMIAKPGNMKLTSYDIHDHSYIKIKLCKPYISS